MATRHDPIDGLLVPVAETLTIDAVTTDLSSTRPVNRASDSPRPGLAVASQDGSKLVPRIHGGQEWDARVRCVVEGSPGRERACQLAVRVDDAHGAAYTDARYMLWQPPNYISGWNSPYWSDTTPLDGWAGVVQPSTGRVVVLTTEPEGYTGSPVPGLGWTSATTAPTSVNEDGLAMVALPSGRIVAFWQTGSASPMWYTDDAGDNWYIGGRRVMPDGVAASVDRADACYLHGNVLWVIRKTSSSANFYQLASSNDGVTFDLVEEVASLVSTTGPYSGPSVVAVGGRILVGYLRNSDGYPTISILGSAYDPISGADTVVIDSAAGAEMALCAEDDGIVWCFLRRFATSDHVDLLVSYDYGDTWTEMDHGVFHWSSGGTDSLLRLRPLATVGMVCLLHEWQANVANEDGSLGALWLGGWSSTAMGVPDSGRLIDSVAERYGHGYDNGGAGALAGHTWLPIELPHDGPGWTHAATGGTVQLESPGHMSVATAAASDYWTISTGGTRVQGVVTFAVDVQSGGSVTADDVVVRVRWASGVSDYDVTFRMSATTNQVRLVDNNNSGATLFTASLTFPYGIYRIFQIEYGTGTNWVVKWRTLAETYWTEIGTAASTNDTSTPAATGLIGFGHVAASTAESDWLFVAWKEGAEVVDDVSGAVFSRPISAAPVPIPAIGSFIDSSATVARLSAVDGPGVINEEWIVKAASDYPWEAMLVGVSPSPDVGWRQSSKAGIDLTWDLGDDTWLGPLAVLVQRHNLISFSVGWRDSAAGSFTGSTCSPGDGISGSALTYDRTGLTVYPASGTTASSRFIHANELAGGIFYDATDAVAHRIASNTAGWWTDNTEAVPQLVLEDTTGLTTSASTSSTCFIQPPDTLFFLPASTYYRVRYLRFSIGGVITTPNSEGFRVGNLIIGHVRPFGREAAWAGGWEVGGNISLRRSRYGTSRARQLGPPAKRWRLSFADPMDYGRLRQAADVDYRAPASAGAPWGPIEDTATMLHGVLETTRGGERPVVAVHGLPTTASATTVTDRTRWCYGRMLGPVNATMPTGDLGTDELIRLDPIEIDPIV